MLISNAYAQAAASQDPTGGLMGLLRKKQWHGRLIVASSMSIYGEGFEHRGIREDDPLNATSFYAQSKRHQEEMCLLFGRTYQGPVVAMRYFNIYGERQALSNPYTGVAAIFASRLLNRRAPMIFEDGRQMRDFVSVHDVVEANLLAMERPEADGMALNVGSGESIPVREVATALGRALGVDMPAEITGKYRAGDIRHCYADISAARKVLGYRPRVRFTEGIAELVEWLRPQQAEDRAAQAVQELNAYGLTA